MQKILRLFLFFGLGLALLSSSLPDKVLADGSAGLSSLVISELQTGGCIAYDVLNPDKCVNEDGDMEFIELYNPLATEVKLVSWKVQYLSASGATITDLAILSGKILPQSYALISHSGYLAEAADLSFGSSLGKSGGHIRITDSTNQIVDLMGWGTASAAGVWPKTPEIKPDYSVKRILPDNPLFGMGFVFTPSTLPITPQGGGYVPEPPDDNEEEPPVNDDEEPEPGTGGSGSGPESSCDGVIINELLPNPAGSDTGHEFIELFNTTSDFIPLKGCKLSTGSKTFEFTAAAGELNPGQYKAFYNDNTGLTLANSSGGTVYLIDSDGTTEINQVDYAADLDDDVSWSLIDGKWASTFSVTPNAPNNLLAIQPCPTGQTRNTDTNRCINIVTDAAGLSSCAAGKERNPETHRCRNITSLTSVLTACASNQVRNPETNRCRKIGSSGSLAPCKEGQQRNPETNRCRNASGSSSGDITDVKDVLSSSTSADKVSWLIAGGSVLGALGYGLWEWRNELLQQFLLLKNKFVLSKN